MIAHGDVPFRLIIASELLTMGGVRAYYSLSRTGEPAQNGSPRRAESAWLTATLGALAVLEFGSVFVYLANPSFMEWSAFEVAAPIRWIGTLISCLGAAGEVWAAISLGRSYSPLLRVSEERVVVTSGPYRWIRHPLYAFGLPMMAGWGVAGRNWFILATGTILVLLLMIIRAPREEAMMLDGFGESYRRYMTRTARFVPRPRSAQGK